MTSYDNLKKAAEAATIPLKKNANILEFGAYCDVQEWFKKLSNPVTILALLAEREKLLKVVEAANKIMDYGTRIEYRDLADALKELDK